MLEVKPKYTQEFREIVERVPGGYTAKISIGLVAFLLILFFMGYIIKTPQKIEAAIKITSTNPPVTLNAHSSGKIVLLRNSFPSKCEENEYIAMIENSAVPHDVQLLKRKLRQLDLFEDEKIIDDLFDTPIKLGEIESAYSEFRINLQDYHSLAKDSKYEHQIKMLALKMHNDSLIIDKKINILNNSRKGYNIKEKMAIIDSISLTQKLIFEGEYNRSELLRIDSDNQLTTLDIEILNIKQSIIDAQLEKNNLETEHSRAVKVARFKVADSFQYLHAIIQDWEKRYIFLSRYSGTVELVNFISDGYFVTAGDPVFNVVFEKNQYQGIAMLPSLGAGEVKEGQQVNIMLDLYPYQEFGMLKGEIVSIAKNTSDNNYLVNVSLNNGLTSTSNISLTFAETMHGNAEVIIEDRRLIQVIYYKVYKMLSSSKATKRNDNPDKPS